MKLMEVGQFFYNKRRGIFGIAKYVSQRSSKGVFMDEDDRIHFSGDCIVLYPDTPQNRLAIQLKYG